MNAWKLKQKYLFNVFLAISMLGASILACSFTADTNPKPDHYGVFFQQNGELIELQEQEIFNIPIEERMGNIQTISEVQPTIIIWRSNTNLNYLEFLKLNQFLGQPKNSVSYNAKPQDDGIIEITPKSTLEDGVYCLIQGDPLAAFLPGWCFRIGTASTNLVVPTSDINNDRVTPETNLATSTPAKISDEDLIAFYILDNTAQDSLNNYPPMKLENAPFSDGGVYCNGNYGFPGSGYTDYCLIETSNIDEMNYQNFTVSIDFKIDDYPEYTDIPDLMPIINLGPQGSWAGIFLRKNGGVGVRVNYTTYQFCGGQSSSDQYKLETWHNAVLNYDGNFIELYLDQERICYFQVSIIEYEGDKIITTNNYSYGIAFKGIMKNLKIYKVALVP